MTSRTRQMLDTGTDTFLTPAAPAPAIPVDLPDLRPPAHPDDIPCLVQDPELWFAENPAQLQIAQEFCRGCPVRRWCLSGAISRREPWGVWGGEIFDNGTIIARKRPRGRPRKNDSGAAA